MNILSVPLFCDLSIAYAEDRETTYHYLTMDYGIDVEKIEKISSNNINSVLPILRTIDDDIPLFTIDTLAAEQSDLEASLLLNSALKKQIKAKIGSQYLFCLPFDNLLLISGVDKVELYVSMMSAITSQFINSAYKLSDNIYFSINSSVKIIERMNLI